MPLKPDKKLRLFDLTICESRSLFSLTIPIKRPNSSYTLSSSPLYCDIPNWMLIHWCYGTNSGFDIDSNNGLGLKKYSAISFLFGKRYSMNESCSFIKKQLFTASLIRFAAQVFAPMFTHRLPEYSHPWLAGCHLPSIVIGMSSEPPERTEETFKKVATSVMGKQISLGAKSFLWNWF